MMQGKKIIFQRSMTHKRDEGLLTKDGLSKENKNSFSRGDHEMKGFGEREKKKTKK